MVKMLLSVLAVLAGVSSALAQSFPDKRVTIVLPTTAGTSTDTMGRFLADALSKKWAQPVVVENRAGAGSSIGTGYVVKSKPDGYTLLFNNNNLTTAAAVETNMPFDIIKDLVPVSLVARGDIGLFVGTRVPAKTLADVARLAQSQKLFFATTGSGSASWFATQLFAGVAKIKLEQVNYKGGSEAVIDLGGGRLDFYASAVATMMPSLTPNSGITPLAIAGPTRSKALPQVPTVAEAGFPGAEFDFWWGIFAPVGTPAEIVAKINKDVAEIMALPETTTFMDQYGAAPAAPSSPQDFSKLFAAEVKTMKDVAARHNVAQ